jgi:hypothetical protein
MLRCTKSPGQKLTLCSIGNSHSITAYYSLGVHDLRQYISFIKQDSTFSTYSQERAQLTKNTICYNRRRQQRCIPWGATGGMKRLGMRNCRGPPARVPKLHSLWGPQRPEACTFSLFCCTRHFRHVVSKIAHRADHSHTVTGTDSYAAPCRAGRFERRGRGRGTGGNQRRARRWGVGSGYRAAPLRG